MPAILTSDVGQVRILTLNRPEVRNALDRELRAELTEALLSAERAGRVRAAVLTGSGTAFCAGMDLSELESMLDRSAEEHLEDSRGLAELFLTIYSFPKPLVAAVNGHAVAGGAGLASLCDVVVASEDARLGYTEARIGFVAALVGVFLTRLLGERAARELLLDARLIDAAEARRRGLVSEVAPAKDVLERALARARTLAANSPAALAATKRLLTESGGLPLHEALEKAITVNVEARSGDDLREGIRAFLEKRTPSWSPPIADDA
jgi:methylglutaconyl-CoA hydratase